MKKLFTIMIILGIVTQMTSSQCNSQDILKRVETKFIATIIQNKLVLQINDNITYEGEIESSPYYDIKELKSLFQKGQVQVLSKTTSKIIIKLSVLKIELESEESRNVNELKKKIDELESQLKKIVEWEEEDLDSKTSFDLNYIYKIQTSGGYSCLSTSVSTANIFFYAGTSNYNIATSNRKTCSAGWTVTKIMKKKI